MRRLPCQRRIVRLFPSSPSPSPSPTGEFARLYLTVRDILFKSKMNSLKTVAAKVKHSPQVIRKTFSGAGSPSPYAKVTEGEKSKGMRYV